MVGRSPGSARVPLDPLFEALLTTTRPARGPAADQGVGPTKAIYHPVKDLGEHSKSLWTSIYTR